MNEAGMHVSESEAPEVSADEAPRGRTRTCVGCGERVAVASPAGEDLVRLILGAGGEIAVDSKGGGFGRGAHVHARRACLERAAKAGLLRATRGAAHHMSPADPGGDGEGERLSADSLARAIQRSMDRRIEGLLAAAVRSRQLARGSNAVVGACQRGEAALLLVACDAAAAADLGEVRRATAEGRAVAWSTKEGLGAIVASRPVRGKVGASADVPEGVGVIAITSRRIAEALARAVRMASACGGGSGPPQRRAREVSPDASPPRREASGRPAGRAQPRARRARDHRNAG